jgi:hypothetical protein
MKLKLNRINVARLREAHGLSTVATADNEPEPVVSVENALRNPGVDGASIDRDREYRTKRAAVEQAERKKALPPPRDLRASPPSPPPGYGASPYREEQQLPEIEEVDTSPTTAAMEIALARERARLNRGDPQPIRGTPAWTAWWSREQRRRQNPLLVEDPGEMRERDALARIDELREEDLRFLRTGRRARPAYESWDGKRRLYRNRATGRVLS